MKKILRILGRIGLLLLLVIIGLVLYIQLGWNKKHDVPYPEIKASTDSTIIARGKYIAFGPAHCSVCHVPMDSIIEVENGLDIPLSGGWELSFPGFGTFRAPNLTPDAETGIGGRTDGEIARAMRHGVRHDGTAMVPFMPFHEMSDEDVTAVISFLRSQPAVKSKIEPTELAFMGKALFAFGVMGPVIKDTPAPASMRRDTTIAYGKYLCTTVANCQGCHTKYDMMRGEPAGPAFSGGELFPADGFTEGYSFVSPNLTSDPETGWMYSWTEDQFVKRFKSGRVHKGSPMPWGAFSRMDELDVRAIYRYIRSLPAINHDVPKVVFAPGEELPAH